MKFIKNSVLALGLMMTSHFSLANTDEVDQETQALVLESIRLELIHNYSLRDPQDNQPLDIDESKMDIFGVSVVLSAEDGSANYNYKVEVPYQTLDGESGTLLCTVPLIELQGVRTVSKANCFYRSLPEDVGLQGGVYTIEEFVQLMTNHF